MFLPPRQNTGQNHDAEITNIALKCSTVQIFGNDSNKSKPDSGENYEETEFG
jgi:hypothetical protein